jgi:hypothetical protein
MTKSKDLLREFVESVRGKNDAEVITMADHEATRAYRNSLRPCDGLRQHSSQWCQYSKNLVQLIYFLRHEVKPTKSGNYPFNLFNWLQNGIEQEDRKSVFKRRLING